MGEAWKGKTVQVQSPASWREAPEGVCHPPPPMPGRSRVREGGRLHLLGCVHLFWARAPALGTCTFSGHVHRPGCVHLLCVHAPGLGACTYLGAGTCLGGCTCSGRVHLSGARAGKGRLGAGRGFHKAEPSSSPTGHESRTQGELRGPRLGRTKGCLL